MKLNHTRTGVLVAVAVGAAAMAQAGQVRRQGGSSTAMVTVKVALNAAGQSLSSSGSGTCTHADKASIYNVPSEMWTVRQQGEGAGGSTQLTLWRPADGSEEMFSLSISGAKDISISTVRGGTVTGSGTARFQAKDKGGTFTINAKTKNGDAVNGTIECSAFTPAVAEGGNL